MKTQHSNYSNHSRVNRSLITCLFTYLLIWSHFRLATYIKTVFLQDCNANSVSYLNVQSDNCRCLVKINLYGLSLYKNQSSSCRYTKLPTSKLHIKSWFRISNLRGTVFFIPFSLLGFYALYIFT